MKRSRKTDHTQRHSAAQREVLRLLKDQEMQSGCDVAALNKLREEIKHTMSDERIQHSRGANTGPQFDNTLASKWALVLHLFDNHYASHWTPVTNAGKNLNCDSCHDRRLHRQNLLLQQRSENQNIMSNSVDDTGKRDVAFILDAISALNMRWEIIYDRIHWLRREYHGIEEREHSWLGKCESADSLALFSCTLVRSLLGSHTCKNSLFHPLEKYESHEHDANQREEEVDKYSGTSEFQIQKYANTSRMDQENAIWEKRVREWKTVQKEKNTVPQSLVAHSPFHEHPLKTALNDLRTKFREHMDRVESLSKSFDDIAEHSTSLNSSVKVILPTLSSRRRGTFSLSQEFLFLLRTVSIATYKKKLINF